MPDEGDKPVPGSPQGREVVPFGEALTQAVKELSGHPPFVSAIAIGILLVAIATLVPGIGREIVLALVAVDALGVVAWLAIEAGRQRQTPPRGGVEIGTIKVGPGGRAKNVVIDVEDVSVAETGSRPTNIGTQVVGPAAGLEDAKITVKKVHGNQPGSEREKGKE